MDEKTVIIQKEEGQPVLHLCQRFGTVTEKITPHCSKDPDLIAQIILQSLLESDIP